MRGLNISLGLPMVQEFLGWHYCIMCDRPSVRCPMYLLHVQSKQEQ